MSTFIIRLKYTNKVIVDHPNPPTDTHLVLYDDYNENGHFVFDIIEGIWGNIRHKISGRLVYPTKGTLTPSTGEGLVYHHVRSAAALFALDTVNNLIIHRSGKWVGTQNSHPDPPNGSELVFHDKKDDSVKFEFLSPLDLKAVQIYGQPKVGGAWKIINAVMNPKAEHTTTMEYKVGKSRTTFNESDFCFNWEASAYAKTFFASASTSASFTAMVNKTTSSTWSEESEDTRQIKVSKGDSVVSWQYVFFGEQHGDNTVFQSNILADTKSPDDIPKDFAGPKNTKFSKKKILKKFFS